MNAQEFRAFCMDALTEANHYRSVKKRSEAIEVAYKNLYSFAKTPEPFNWDHFTSDDLNYLKSVIEFDLEVIKNDYAAASQR